VQLFAIRWVRLIFTREVSNSGKIHDSQSCILSLCPSHQLPLSMALGLWDGLFSVDPSFDLVGSICVAMLIRIRSQLLDGDYSHSLQSLLNYPSYAQQSSPLTLIKQAQEIKQSPGTTTLMSIIQENEETLEIPTSSPRQDGTATTFQQQQQQRHYNSFPTPPSLQQLTKGVYAQSLTAGFNRALYNVQRTVNAAYLSHTGDNENSNGFPPSIESPPRPNYPPKDALGELEDVRKSNKAVGTTLDRVIASLEKHWSEEIVGKKMGAEEGQATPMEIEFLLSLTTLKHSRDVLLGTTIDFDPTIIDGPRMIREEKEKEEDQKARDFGQRFKRTVEPEGTSQKASEGKSRTVPSPDRSMQRQASVQKPATPTPTAPPSVQPAPRRPSAVASPRLSVVPPPPTTPIAPQPAYSRKPAKEPIDDPLGAASR
jgi:hypothetical protein